MRKYFFYSKIDSSKEPIFWCKSTNRLSAARKFAIGKQLPLKEFLKIYSVSK